MASGPWGGFGETRVFRVKIQMRHGISLFQTGFHLRDVGVSGQTPEDVATEVASFVTDSFRTILPLGVQIDTIDAVNMATEEGFTVNPAGQFGTVSEGGGLDPLFMMVPVSFKGPLRRRYGQGRGLWPVLLKAYCDGDVLSGAGIAAFQAVVDEMATRYMGAALTHDLHLINIHGTIPPRAATPTRPARPEIPPTWYDVNSIRLNTQVSALHSRKAGVGS